MWGQRGYGGTRDGETPHVPIGTWEQAEGYKGEAHSHRKRRQIQACGAGCRDKQRRLAGGRGGTRPGVRRLEPRKEMGSGCNTYIGIRL